MTHLAVYYERRRLGKNEVERTGKAETKCVETLTASKAIFGPTPGLERRNIYNYDNTDGIQTKSRILC